MRAALLALFLVVPASAVQVEPWRAEPPVATPAWTGPLGGALPALARLDSSLAGLASAEPAAAAALYGPLAERLELLSPQAPQQLQRELRSFSTLSVARKTELAALFTTARAETDQVLASRLRAAERAATDGRIHPGELVDVIERGERYEAYGAGVTSALESAKMTVRTLVAAELIKAFQEKREETSPSGGASQVSPTGGRLAPAAPNGESTRSNQSIPAPRSNLALRTVTAVALVPSVVLLVHLGGAVFVASVSALAGLCALEFANLFQKGGRAIDKTLVVAAAAAIPLAAVFGAPLGLVFPIVGAVIAAREVARPDRSLERWAATSLGAALLGGGLAPLAAVRVLPHGEALALLVFVSAWFTDTAAMAVGKNVGHRKIAPSLSPNKTWEGALGGFAGALLAGVLFHFLGGLPWLAALGVSALVGSIGQLSGMMNSMIKRLNGAKDSGTLLPGHGGFLDRFDTLVLSSAAVFALLLLLA